MTKRHWNCCSVAVAGALFELVRELKEVEE